MAVTLLGSYPIGAAVENGTAEASVSATPPAGCDCIVICYSGWDDNQATGIDIDGNVHNTADVAAANGTAQVSSIFVVTPSDAAWPGTGSSVTFETVSNAPTSEQRRIGVSFFSGVDVTTPVDDTGTQTSTGTTSASIGLTTDTNGICIGNLVCYSGDPAAAGAGETEIYAIRNGTTTSSVYMFVDPSDGASTTLANTISASSNMAYTALALNPAIDANVSASTDSLVITEYQATIDGGSGDTNVAANTDILAITEQQATIVYDVDVQASTDSLAITTYQANVTYALEGVADTFDGTGALDTHWLQYQSSVQTVDRQSGYIEADVSDNTADKTLWFNGDRGRMDYQRVRFPTEAIPNEYVFYNIGVGPTSDPRDDLTYSSGAINFAGLIVHDADTATNSYMFSVVGHRGASAQSTVETKSTVSGSSNVADEGTDVFGAGVTHGDLAVALHNDGRALFKFKDVSAGTWTYINSGTGLTPATRPNLGTGGDEVLVGFISYAQGTTGVPFVGSADSFDVFEGTFKTESLGITTYQTSVNAEANVNANNDTLTITTYQSVVESGADTNVAANTYSLVITEYQASITSNVNVNAGADTLIITEYQAGVSLGVNVAANLATMTITEYQTTIIFDAVVEAGTDSLAITTYQSTIEAAAGNPWVIQANDTTLWTIQ